MAEQLAREKKYSSECSAAAIRYTRVKTWRCGKFRPRWDVKKTKKKKNEEKKLNRNKKRTRRKKAGERKWDTGAHLLGSAEETRRRESSAPDGWGLASQQAFYFFSFFFSSFFCTPPFILYSIFLDGTRNFIRPRARRRRDETDVET